MNVTWDITEEAGVGGTLAFEEGEVGRKELREKDVD